jgi:hypothetical protein
MEKEATMANIQIAVVSQSTLISDNAVTQQTQFDFRKWITAPFAVRPGGFIGINDIVDGLGWQQQPLGAPRRRSR